MKKNKTQEQTAVIFRKWRDGAIIALFPFIGCTRFECMSYEHIGQHGGADYVGVVEQTTQATPAEYGDLLSELRGIGYNLKVLQRRPRTAPLIYHY